MPGRDVEGLPPFPQPPPGTSRIEHLPTVEASIRYWESARDRAITARDHARERTAMGLRRSYEAVLAELNEAAGIRRPTHSKKPAAAVEWSVNLPQLKPSPTSECAGVSIEISRFWTSASSLS